MLTNLPAPLVGAFSVIVQHRRLIVCSTTTDPPTWLQAAVSAASSLKNSCGVKEPCCWSLGGASLHILMSLLNIAPCYVPSNYSPLLELCSVALNVFTRTCLFLGDHNLIDNRYWHNLTTNISTNLHIYTTYLLFLVDLEIMQLINAIVQYKICSVV